MTSKRGNYNNTSLEDFAPLSPNHSSTNIRYGPDMSPNSLSSILGLLTPRMISQRVDVDLGIIDCESMIDVQWDIKHY
jgi:hypothetical protein